MNRDSTELKRCPFCGGEAALVFAPCSTPIAYASCECGANGADFCEADEEDYAAKAIAAWNTRSAQPIGEEMVRLRSVIASYFDHEDAEYTPDEIRAGKADRCIELAINAISQGR